MEEKRKNRSYLVLMSTTVFLLLALQSYWAKKAYDEQQELLQKETRTIWITTLRSLQDSLLDVRLVQPLREYLPDSLIPEPGTRGFRRFALDQARSSFIIRTDSLASGSDTTYTRQIVVNLPAEHHEAAAHTGDLSNISFTLRTLNRTAPSIIDIGTDSLRIAAIDRAFRKGLQTAGITLPFEVRRFPSDVETDSIVTHQFVTPAMRGDIPYGTQYLATFPKTTPFLWRKIFPQLAFSLLVLLFTIGSFSVVYNSLKQQQRLTQLKNDFISNVTHELKTPITTVGVALEALNSFNALQNPEKTKEYLDISKNELHRLSILVDKVLKMSIFESTEIQLKLERIDLRQLTEDILASMKLQFEKHQANIRTHYSDGDFAVQGDKVHLTSVLYNLLDNALKYSEDQPEIHISLSRNNGHCDLAVSDNGLGIPEAYRNRVFEKFFRVPTGDRHNIKGHGLGLSYVASVVQKHGGRIELDSKDGKGSTFTLKLPADQ